MKHVNNTVCADVKSTSKIFQPTDNLPARCFRLTSGRTVKIFTPLDFPTRPIATQCHTPPFSSYKVTKNAEPPNIGYPAVSLETPWPSMPASR